MDKVVLAYWKTTSGFFPTLTGRAEFLLGLNFPPGPVPAARADHSTVYDSKNNRLIVFGGGNDVGLLNDVWILTSANGLGGTPAWTQLGPFSLFAEARAWHISVYNPKTNKMTIFGGATVAGALAATNDVWVLSHANGK